MNAEIQLYSSTIKQQESFELNLVFCVRLHAVKPARVWLPMA